MSDYNDEEWLNQSQINCASCQRPIIGRQIFIPQFIESQLGQPRRYTCSDNTRFCAWWCAARHIKYFMKNDERSKLLLNNLYELWEKKKILEIEPAIPPWNVDTMGGNMTMDEYHKLCEFNMNRFHISFDNEDHHYIDS